MIPPNQSSSLSLDSSLNMTPWENCYILGYEGPNEISQGFPDRELTLISIVNVLEPKGGIVTHGIVCKFAMMNSLEISHLGKLRISPNW